MSTFAIPNEREHSSAGLEHLPYKQGVTGSNPVAPTILRNQNKFFIVYFKCFGGLHNLVQGSFFYLGKTVPKTTPF